MVALIRFGRLVETCGLKPKTAQYVLRTPGALNGMPQSGRQGSHREFSLRQAVQLAICTLLVEGGVELTTSARIVRYCENQIKKLNRFSRADGRAYFSNVTDPWLLCVDDRQYCKLWREQIRRGDAWADKDDDYFNVLSGKHEPASPLRMTRYEINLTQLEHRLAVAVSLD